MSEPMPEPTNDSIVGSQTSIRNESEDESMKQQMIQMLKQRIDENHRLFKENCAKLIEKNPKEYRKIRPQIEMLKQRMEAKYKRLGEVCTEYVEKSKYLNDQYESD
ncbi:hypothetical protein HN011_011011, partial [Eciton burchellii]